MVGGGKDREEMSDLISRSEMIRAIEEHYINLTNDNVPRSIPDFYSEMQKLVYNQPTAFDTEKVVEQLNNVLQDLNVIEVISHIDFDSTIQTSLENFLNAFKSEIIRIVKNNACIDELLKGEEG